MRHTYRLTDATRGQVSNHVREIAEEMDVSEGYLYGILSEHQTDPYARFRHLYRAAVRTGAGTGKWDDDMKRIRTTHKVRRPVHESLSEKIVTDAETTRRLAEALLDGEIDVREAARIQVAIRRERQVLADLEGYIVEVINGCAD